MPMCWASHWPGKRSWGLVVSRKGTLVCAAVVAAAVAASAVNAAPSAPPLVQVTPHELRLSQPLAGLAADGRRAAFAFCDQLVGTWRPGAANVTRLGPVAQWTCPPPRGAEHTYSIAFAGDRVAWAVSAGGNIYTNLVFLVVLSHAHTFTYAAETDYCCRPLDPDPNRMGDVYGAGNFLVFSSRVKCGDLGAPSCPGPTRTVVSQTMWKLQRPPFLAACVNRAGPCVQLTTSAPNATLRPLSVSAGRVLLLNNGVLELRNGSGAITHQFGGGLAAVMRGADLMGNRVLVLVPAALRVYNATNRSRTSRAPASAACRRARLRLCRCKTPPAASWRTRCPASSTCCGCATGARRWSPVRRTRASVRRASSTRTRRRRRGCPGSTSRLGQRFLFDLDAVSW